MDYYFVLTFVQNYLKKIKQNSFYENINICLSVFIWFKALYLSELELSLFDDSVDGLNKCYFRGIVLIELFSKFVFLVVSSEEQFF